VSEYLTRLTTRARESDGMKLLQPSVRSTSPIAEHDQRIAMAPTEEFELVGAPPDRTGSESAVANLGEFQIERRAGIKPENGIGETTAQRKIAAPAVGKAGPFLPTAQVGRPAASGWMSSDVDKAVLGIPGSQKSSLPGAVEVKSRIPEPAASGGTAVRGAPNQHESDEPLAPRATTLIERNWSFPKMKSGDGEPSQSSAEQARLDTRLPDSLGTHDATRQAVQVSVHARSIRQQTEIDSPRLEPKARVAVDHFESSPAGAAAFSAAADESPRIVIGRINVEVVPPAAQQVATAPGPRPLTAAAVSVIGPLGGVRPNMRLSLRYR
jgi:hypothetical protein